MTEQYEQTSPTSDGGVITPPDATPVIRRDTGTYTDGTPVTTQAVYPERASWRSALAASLPVLLLIMGVVPQVIEIVLGEAKGHNVTLPAWLYAALAAISVACVVAVKIVNRVMLLPSFNELLTRLGAGARPAKIQAFAASGRKGEHKLTARSGLTIGALVLLGITELLTWRDDQRGGTVSENWWSLAAVGQLGWWLANGALIGFLVWMLVHFPTKTLDAVDLVGFLAVGVLVAWLLLRFTTVWAA